MSESSVKPVQRPGLKRSRSSSRAAYHEDERDSWAAALTLMDVFETYFDSRLDLLERNIKVQSTRLKQAAAKLIPEGLRTPRGTPVDPDAHDHTAGSGATSQDGKHSKSRNEREIERLRLKIATKVNDLSNQWHSAQIVRTRDKISFVFSVMTLAVTCLVCGYAPEWIPSAYTVQTSFYLVTRFWSYKRKAYHYFLFDLCYFVNVMDLIYIWFFRDNVYFFIMCWCLTLGPIASAIITWRNSLVFHSFDKVTSLFIHLYSPLTLIIIKHFARNREQNYPAILKTKEFSWWQMILWSSIPYVIWQASYWKLVLVDRKEKVESGQRQTSFRYMLNDKHSPIGKMLQGIQPKYRELSFMGGQLVYSIIFMMPAATFLIKSPNSCIGFLLFVFGVSAWNGASYYVEVFGRKFEKELEKLRREMESTPQTAPSSVTNSASNSPPRSPRTGANTALNSYSSQTNLQGAGVSGSSSSSSGGDLHGGGAGSSTLTVPALTTGGGRLEPARGLNDSPLALGPTLASPEQNGGMEELDLDEPKKSR